MQTRELIAQVKPILAHLDETPLDASFLAKGATCSVWQIRTRHRTYALRIIDHTERVTGGDLDAFIRKAVRTNGGRVVAPLLNSEATGLTINDRRWCLDAFAEGTHPPRGHLPQQTCRQLGETLAALHEIPVSHHGKPNHIENGRVMGEKISPFEGVAQRFEKPLPETWKTGYLHPIFNAAPEIEKRLLSRLRLVSERVRQGKAVLCHSDLHERQLICAGGNLTALIDFGDATILDRHWDLGSALYFHGAQNFSAIFASYSGSHGASQSSAKMAAAFSIAIAMHHASRSRLPGKGHRLQRATQWVRQIVENNRF